MARYTSSCSSSSSSKRQKRNHDYAIIRSSSRPRRKQHLYLALDDWEGGYSIHKIDADEIMDDNAHEAAAAAAAATDCRELLHKLPEPAALRLASPVWSCRMSFAATATKIFVATNPRCRCDDDAPKLVVYDAETGALSAGPRIPDQDKFYDWAAASMAVGERLYSLTTVALEFNQCPSFRALSWAPTTKSGSLDLWDPRMEWSWSSVPPPRFNGYDIAAYALHPDGRTIFVSTTSPDTHAFDSGDGVWTELGDWVLPFRGQAYFDAELDAWVGLHHKEDGYVCCCPVASRSAIAMEPPVCRKLKEKLFGKGNYPKRQRLNTTLTYMGDSRLCLIENVMPREDDDHNAVLHVTLFGLKYDHKGELQTKIRRKTRSYAVSKNTTLFSHAAFWL